jgi:hypothetical protein
MIWKFRPLAGCLALVSLCASAVGQGTPLTAEEIGGAVLTDDLSIPMPGEFMAALSKIGKVDWGSKVRPPIATNYSSRMQTALNLGGLIADGYIAVEATDGQQVKNLGKDVIQLAKGLGVSKEVVDRANSIASFAEQNQWEQLKEELEATQNEVKSAMAEKADKDLVTLVTVGGWLRALEVTSGHVASHYTEAGAKLLRQPGIASFLSKNLESLPEKVREDASVKVARKRMTEIEKLIAFPTDKAPTQEDVKELNKIAAETVKEIAKKQK